MASLVSSIFAPTTLQPPAVVTLPISYTTALLVSQWTGGDVLPSEVASEWIDQAREEIDRHSGLSFTSLNETDELDGDGLKTIFLENFPVLELLEVTVDGRDISLSDVILNHRTGSLKRRGGDHWPFGCRNVVVSYIQGYRVVPPLVQKIATILVAKTALASKQENLIDSESIGDFTQSRSFKKLNDQLDRAWEALGKRFPIHLI